MLGSQWQALLGGGNAVKRRLKLRKRTAAGLVVKSPRRVELALVSGSVASCFTHSFYEAGSPERSRRAAPL